ncbi:MAG: hypothetical protein ACREGA_00795 [Candidatus Saccharimonadales bacterium]
MSNVTDKQLKANRKNAPLGGVKTEVGKQKSKYNAVKHNVLTDLLYNDEAKQAQGVKFKLGLQFVPVGIAEDMLVERMAIWYVRLQRAVTAEAEYLKMIDNPRIEKTVETGREYLPLYETKTEVISEGYMPNISENTIERLASTFFRYETAIERNFYKSLHELQRLQAARDNSGMMPAPDAEDEG